MYPVCYTASVKRINLMDAARLRTELQALKSATPNTEVRDPLLDVDKLN